SATSSVRTTRWASSIPALYFPRPIGRRSPISRSVPTPRRFPTISRPACARSSAPPRGPPRSSSWRRPDPWPPTADGNLPRGARRSQGYVDEWPAGFVMPPAIVGDATLEAEWQQQGAAAQAAYVRAVEGLMERYAGVADKVHRRKMAREAARSVLPNATEVKIVVSGNARAWRTMLELRTSEGAELEIRGMAIACLRVLQREAPGLFCAFE